MREAHNNQPRIMDYCSWLFYAEVAKLAKRTGLKIPHIRNTVGSNPTFSTNLELKI